MDFMDELFAPVGGFEAYSAYVMGIGRREVVDGREIEAQQPRGQHDGWFAFALSFHIEEYLLQYPRGRCFRPPPPFILSTEPVTIRVPDVAFIETHKLACNSKWDALCPIVPDLVGEVISQPARWDEVDARVGAFLAAGTSIAWILDVMERRLIVRRRKGQAQVFTYHQKVLSAPVLPRLNKYVYELLGE